MRSSPRVFVLLACLGALSACGDDKYIYDGGDDPSGGDDSGETDDSGEDDDGGGDDGGGDTGIDGTDGDGDGFVDEAEGGTDCDDTNNLVYPGATEFCNGFDDNCDGEIDEDLAIDPVCFDDDGDGYGDASTESTDCQNDGDSSWVSDCTDCDDTLSAVNPGGTEICDGEVDEDCDGLVDDDDDSLDTSSGTTWYTDADGDGYGDWESVVEACEQPSGTVEEGRDCDDTDAELTPESGCEGDWDGSYAGTLTADFAETLFGLSDTCAGSISLEVDTYGTAPITGALDCTFTGDLAILFSDPLEGDITGDFTGADTAVITGDFSGMFTVDIDVSFVDPDTAEGAWSGSDSSTGFTITYDGTFEATR